MSNPDYYSEAADHQALLVLVKQIGSSTTLKSFNRIYERVARLHEVRIKDAQGMGFERVIRLRFRKGDYRQVDNDWGDFQAYRKVLGLITVGKNPSPATPNIEADRPSDDRSIHDLKELLTEHEKAKSEYSFTLYDSRCLVYNQSPVSSPMSPTADVVSTSPKQMSAINSDDFDDTEILEAVRFSNDDRREFAFKTEPVHTLSPGDHNHFSSMKCNESSQANVSPSSPTAVNSSMVKVVNDPLRSPPEAPPSPVSLPLTVSDHVSATNANRPSKATSKSRTKTPENKKSNSTQIIYYAMHQGNENEFRGDQQLEEDLKEFFSSLFWILESKRLDRSYEKIDKVPLLVAPFETKQMVGLDTDTRLYKKRCMARMRKYVGDLSLLAGLPSEGLTHYAYAIEIFRSVGDWLWLAAALEGQCVASLLLTYPSQTRRKASLQRNKSLPANKFGQLQREANSLQESMTTKKNAFSSSYSGSSSSASMSSSSLSRSLPNGVDPMMAKALGKSLLTTPNDIYEKYKESCCHYAKFRHAAIVELDCSLKATRVLSLQEKYLWASEFIQNAVFITIGQDMNELVQRLQMISQLYTKIGFHRKSAFFRRFAAKRAISANRQSPNWTQRYYLLLPALDGYQLTLDPIEYERRTASGVLAWPGIHIHLLQELISTAIRMNSEPLAVRHLSFLLQALFTHLSPAQKEEFAQQLETLTSRCGEGAPFPLTLENGSIVPSVNLTKFPLVTSFKIQNLEPHLRPVKLKTKGRGSISLNSNPSSPFIFTPLQLNRSNIRRQSMSVSQTLDFKWVQGEVGIVSLQVFNYLPVDLNVNHMALMTDGVAFETYPTTLTLPPHSGPYPVQLTGTPRTAGKLDIMGYTTHVLGVRSDCRLSELPNAKKMKLPVNYSIDVIGPLPLMGVECSVPKANQFADSDVPNIVSSVSMTLYAGETQTFNVSLSNNSTNGELIDIVNVKTTSNLSRSDEECLLKWNEDDINNNLPLAVKSHLSFDVTVHGVAHFVSKSNEARPMAKLATLASAVASGTASPANVSSSQSSPQHTGGMSSTKKHQKLLGSTLANFLSNLQRNNKQMKLEETTSSMAPSLEAVQTKTIEAVMQFEYSGGPGLSSGFCRQIALVINIEVMPSVLLTHWDVIPAEMSSQCYLVFDVLNQMQQEVELHYAPNKSILIEPKETCRIPVTVDRCPHDPDADPYAHLLQKCRKHLVDQVDLNWSIPGCDQSGKSSIVNVPWTDKMLEQILTA